MLAASQDRKTPGWKPCTKETENCKHWTSGKDTLRPECCTDHLKELLFYVEDLLTRHGIFHWLDFGTLLGAVRDQELIPWDTDVDFSFLELDENKIDPLQEEINRAGYYFSAKSNPRFGWRVYYSQTNLIRASVTTWWDKGGLLRRRARYKRIPGWSFPPHYIEKLTPVSIYGKEFPAPSPVHEFLAQHRYGPDYLTPQRRTWNEATVPDLDIGELTSLAQQLLGEIGERDCLIQQLENELQLKVNQGKGSGGSPKILSERTQLRMRLWYFSSSNLAQIAQRIYRRVFWQSKSVRWALIGRLALICHRLNLDWMKPGVVTIGQLPEISIEEFTPVMGQLLYTIRVRDAHIRKLETRAQNAAPMKEPSGPKEEFSSYQDASK